MAHAAAVRRALLGLLVAAALVFVVVQFGGKASSLLHDLRPAKSTEAALQLPPPGKCPTAILRHPARSRKVVETFEECLLRHGKDINRRVVTKWLRAAEAATGRDRVEYMARHIVDLWMWTLAQRHNTPCVPLIITFRCNNEGTGAKPHCSGVGDRIKGVEVAFWLAVFTNSVFVLDWNRPAPLTEFFVPALPELHFPEFRDCIGNSRLEPTHWVPHLRPMRAGDTNITMHLDSLHRISELYAVLGWHRYDWVQIKCNHGILAYVLRAHSLAASRKRYNMDRAPLRDFLYITNRLWMGTPTQRLLTMAEPFAKRIQHVPGTLAIGVHLRMGDSGLSNAEKRNDLRIPLEAVVCWVDRVVQQCDAASPRKCIVFLASDSSVAARVFIDEVASRGLDVMTAPGEAIHIDWVNTTAATPDELIEQASKTYLDWYMLTQMDTLVMSSGSFAFTAAYSYIGDSAVYMPNGSDGQCRFRDFEHECVKEACPGQVDFYSEVLLNEAWNGGPYPVAPSGRRRRLRTT